MSVGGHECCGRACGEPGAAPAARDADGPRRCGCSRSERWRAEPVIGDSGRVGLDQDIPVRQQAGPGIARALAPQAHVGKVWAGRPGIGLYVVDRGVGDRLVGHASIRIGAGGP